MSIRPGRDDIACAIDDCEIASDIALRDALTRRRNASVADENAAAPLRHRHWIDEPRIDQSERKGVRFGRQAVHGEREERLGALA